MPIGVFLVLVSMRGKIRFTMKTRRYLSFFPVLLLTMTSVARAEFPSAQPYPEVRYEHRSTTAPAQQIHIARVDLADADVDVRVAPGDSDPDGTGEYQTVLRVPTAIAERERFELAINGDFFTARKTEDVEGAKSGFVAGKWSKVIGPAVTDGFLWAPASETRAALLLDAKKRPRIAMTKDVPSDAHQVIAGSNILVSEGKIVVERESSFSKTRHPRTAIGIAGDGTLVLVVVDGRQAGVAVGMSLTELAELMRGLGCRDALNLDGGGSTEMVMRDSQSGELRVLNRPSDGRERAVANVLGVSIRGSRRTPNALSAAAPATLPTIVFPSTGETKSEK